jgi:hypothetical protein
MEDKGIKIIVSVVIIGAIALIAFIGAVYGRELIYGPEREQTPEETPVIGKYYLIPVGEVPPTDLEFAEKALEAGTGMEFTITGPI